MAASTTTPNATFPQTLTPVQARALLHTLLSTTPDGVAGPTSTTPNASRPRPTNTTSKSSSPTKPTKTIRPTPQQHNITIDASTRVMGHCNNVQVSPVSATEIEEMVRGALTATATADKETNVNIAINACLNLMGSKNVVVFGNKPKSAVAAKDATTVNDAAKAKDALAAIVKTKSDRLLAGRKRRAQSEPADTEAVIGKKVKVEV